MYDAKRTATGSSGGFSAKVESMVCRQNCIRIDPMVGLETHVRNPSQFDIEGANSHICWNHTRTDEMSEGVRW